MTPPNPYEMMQEALEAMLVFCHPGNPKHIAARAALAESRKWDAALGEIDHHSPPDYGLWVAFWGGEVGHEPGHSPVPFQRPAILLVRKPDTDDPHA